MNSWFIIRTFWAGAGHYGKGKTLAEAEAALVKTRRYKRDKKGEQRVVDTFTSELPFAPHDRKATEQEADAWVGQDGSLNWVRCEHVDSRSFVLHE